MSIRWSWYRAFLMFRWHVLSKVVSTWVIYGIMVPNFRCLLAREKFDHQIIEMFVIHGIIVFATMVLCYVKLKSHVLSFEVEELILCGRLRTFAARSRSSSLDISDRARRSHSTPCEKASTWSSSNFAANATFRSFTYSIQHSATTKKKKLTRLHHATNIQLLAKI